jgi:putative exporter of polyketide antibiotics
MQNEKQQNEIISKGKEMGQKVFAETKEATGQAIKALKILSRDPIGGQSEAIKNLGQSNGLRAGIVLVVIFSISCFLLGDSIVSESQVVGEYMGGLAGTYFKLLLFSLIPSASVFVCFFLIMKLISQEKEEISTCIYTTGVSTLPLAVLFFCIKIFGLSNFELLSAIGIFCLSTTFFLINSSMQDIYKLSTQKSFLITPTLVLLAGVVSNVLYSALI